MANNNKPPMFGHSGVINPVAYVLRSGKSTLTNELMAEFMSEPMNDLQHLKVWGSTREGMSTMSATAKIALLDDDSLMLVSRGTVERDSMPPGFVRFLSEDEVIERGLQSCIPKLVMREGRKWNAGHQGGQIKAVPYYRQFDKRKF